jgi:uncharacterized cupredoxin-like copper-binding protein
MKAPYLAIFFVALTSTYSPFTWASGSHHGTHAPTKQASHKHALFEASSNKASRTISIQMKDPFVFNPKVLEVRSGEVIRLNFQNTGKTNHEFMLDESEQGLRDHAKTMLNNPNMIHHDGTAITLKPGEKGFMNIRFNRAGIAYFGCMVPGHYEGGMKGHIQIKVI